MFERWGEQYSELTNTLDFNIIIHQSRNIVKPKFSDILRHLLGIGIKRALRLGEYEKGAAAAGCSFCVLNRSINGNLTVLLPFCYLMYE